MREGHPQHRLHGRSGEERRPAGRLTTAPQAQASATAEQQALPSSKQGPRPRQRPDTRALAPAKVRAWGRGPSHRGWLHVQGSRAATLACLQKGAASLGFRLDVPNAPLESVAGS